jgi:hypothetical protein
MSLQWQQFISNKSLLTLCFISVSCWDCETQSGVTQKFYKCRFHNATTDENITKVNWSTAFGEQSKDPTIVNITIVNCFIPLTPLGVA